MAEFPIPFTGESVDTDRGAATNAMIIIGVIGGFALLTMAQRAGQTVYQKGNGLFAQFTGYQLSGSQDDGPGGV